MGATGALLAVGFLASAASAAATISSSRAQAKAQRFQAGVLQEQAAVEAQNNALEADRARREFARMEGRQRALFAASGVDVSSGTPLLVAEDSAAEAERTVFNIQRGLLLREKRLLQESELMKFNANTTEKSGLIRGGALLLGGTANTLALSSGAKA